MDHRRSYSPAPRQPSSVVGSEDSSSARLGRDQHSPTPPATSRSHLMQSPRSHETNIGGSGGAAQQQSLANVMSSPLSSRRFLPPMPVQIPPTSQHSQHHYPAYIPSALEAGGVAKMLVDPLTGQHYYLPTAHSGPMMAAATAYYPVYPAPPQPAMLIQHHHHQAPSQFPPPGFALVATTQPQSIQPLQPPQSPTHHRHHASTPPQPFFHYPIHQYATQLPQHYAESMSGHQPHYAESMSGHQPHYQYQPQRHRELSGGEERNYYRVEVPPSSAASVCCDEMAPAPTQPPMSAHLQDEQYQMSMTDRRLHLPPTTYHSVSAGNRPSQTHQAGAGGVESTSSSSTNTSGFLSNGSAVLTNNVRRLFGPYNDVQPRAIASSPSPPAPAPPPPPQPLAVVQRPVRMDIDLNRPLTPPSPPPKAVQSCSTPRKTPLAPPPTAFTISFGRAEATDSGGSAEKKEPVVGSSAQFSLQDAARQAPTGRRMLKKAEEALRQQQRARQEDKEFHNSSNTTSPKQYLFNKMLQGLEGAGGHRHSGQHSTTGVSSDNERGGEISDVQSEAGTFIIERKSAKSTPSPMERSRRTVERVEEDDDSDARSTDSSTTATTPTATTPSSSVRSSNRKSVGESRMKQRAVKLPPLAGLGGAQAGTGPQPPEGASKRSLMTDLRRLCEEKGSPRGALGATTRPQRPCQQQPLARHQQHSHSQRQQHQRPCSSGSHFNRGDGGRYSMRTGHPQSARLPPHPFSSASRLAEGRPPFRTGTGSGYAKPSKTQFHHHQQEQQQVDESPEMAAWLRRKEYDPRKSAAEARRLQQLKQREVFLANRSLSYHNTGGRADLSTSINWKSNKREPHHLMGDDRSNRSYDELSRLGEEESAGEEAFCGGSSAGATEAPSLKRTIDDLTEKCQRSIELLRLCNRNQLSESVENLLESVIVVDEGETPPAAKSEGGLAERLDKLNSAFDAIQKYLEDQSSGGGRASTNASLSPPLSQHSSGGGLARQARAASLAAPNTTTTPHSSSTSRLLAGLCTLTGEKQNEAESPDKRTF